MQPLIISPSILSANLLELGSQTWACQQGGADWHHIDVMDGHYVPQITFGSELVAHMSGFSSIPLDVHLMIEGPENFISDFVNAGAHLITFHWEAATHHIRLIDQIKSQGIKAGVAINPGTPITVLEPLISFLDVILMMCVNPGFGGQKMLSNSVSRVAQVHRLLKKHGLEQKVLIEVDGGICAENIGSLRKSGASVFVAGSCIYRSKTDFRTTITSLRQAANIFQEQR